MPSIMTRFSVLPAGLLVLGLASLAAQAQPAFDLPRQSPSATVSQTFGYTTVTVKYSRPAVNGRVIWGGVVPYGRVWRAGANEATTVEFSRDVQVNGHALPAGLYALFVLPEKNAWTFIFSRNSKTWGSFSYDPKDDALCLTVTPEAAPHKERMEIGFGTITDSGATMTLQWEKLKGSVALTGEFLETGKANIAKGMPGIKAEDPYSWLNAARFYWTYNIDRKQALVWVDKSIAVKPLYNNLWAKAEWLAQDKRYAEAVATGKLARAEAAKDPNLASQVPAIDKAMKGWTK